MTEFELKQLEYLQFDRQQGLITLIQSQADLISNDMTMLSTFLFGYLVVAYFVGANLSKVQSIIFTTLYVMAYSAGLFSAVNSAFVAVGLQSAYVSISGNTSTPTLTLPFVASGAILNISMLLASLYFMWSIRHPKTE